MYSLLMTLILTASILLMIVILLQPSKGNMVATLGGLSGQFTGMFGARGGVKMLHKITVYIALAVLLLVILINKFGVEHTTQEIKPVSEGLAVPTATNPVVPTQQPLQSQPAEKK